MKRIITLLGLLLCTFALSAQEYSYERDIHYRSEISTDPAVSLSSDAYVQEICTLDVAYMPGGEDRPVIVWFHGGGLTGGRKEVPEALCTRGYIVIGVGYRLAPKVSVAEIVDDAAAAVAWVFKNAARFGGSTSKIYLSGHSAGGYLIDMIGLDKSWLERYGVDADDVAALVPYSGQVVTHYTERAAQGIGPLDPIIDSLAPLSHMRADCPPMLVISGDRETELYGRYEETAYFVRMMKLHGHKDITFYELDGFDHGSMVAPGHLLMLRYIASRERAR